MTRIAVYIVSAAFILAILAPMAVATTSKSLNLGVYSNGYVYVTQVLSTDTKATSVQVPLLSSMIANLVATDQNGSPLSYGLNSGGANVTVYTLGASSITVRYDTGSLTSKNGTVWTLSFTARYNSTVILPQFSTLLDARSVSGTLYSINKTNSAPEVALSPGTWKVLYGVSFTSGTSTSVSTTGSGTQGGTLGAYSSQWEEIAAVVVVAAAGGVFSLLWWRRRRLGRISGDLRPDDVQVLNFIQEKGGKVLELEIRTRFALPKTSAWRQIKRLERLGYVKVTKIGTQNQIELLKERNVEN